MRRTLLLLLLLFGVAASSALAQNATSSSTGIDAGNSTALSSSTGVDAINSTISSSTGTDNSTSSSTGVEAAVVEPTTEDTYWRKAYDWLFFSDWGKFTIGATVLGIVFLISLNIYIQRRRANAVRKLADSAFKEQAEPEGHVTFRNGFNNTVPLNEKEEADEGDASALPAYFEHPSKYASLRSK